MPNGQNPGHFCLRKRVPESNSTAHLLCEPLRFSLFEGTRQRSSCLNDAPTSEQRTATNSSDCDTWADGRGVPVGHIEV